MTRRAVKAGGLLLGLALCLGLMLALRPPCLILKYTGFFCAGCGVQHMLLALARGDLAGALSQNAFMFFFLPLTGLFILTEALRYIRGKPLWCRSKAFLFVLLGLLILAGIFTVLRNLPAFRWLAPGWAAQGLSAP